MRLTDQTRSRISFATEFCNEASKNKKLAKSAYLAISRRHRISTTTKYSGKFRKITAEPQEAPKGKRSPTPKVLREAAKAMGNSDGMIHSTDRFVTECIRFLAAKWGDLHIEYLKGDGWGVGSCYLETDEWFRGSRLDVALARAVVGLMEGR